MLRGLRSPVLDVEVPGRCRPSSGAIAEHLGRKRLAVDPLTDYIEEKNGRFT
jgi:hypothetical protein